MAGFTRVDFYRVIEVRDGCVYKTRKEGSAWYEIGKVPADTPERIHASTTDYHFGPTKPDDHAKT